MAGRVLPAVLLVSAYLLAGFAVLSTFVTYVPEAVVRAQWTIGGYAVVVSAARLTGVAW